MGMVADELVPDRIENQSKSGVHVDNKRCRPTINISQTTGVFPRIQSDTRSHNRLVFAGGVGAENHDPTRTPK
jgi:hypothetical protein